MGILSQKRPIRLPSTAKLQNSTQLKCHLFLKHRIILVDKTDHQTPGAGDEAEGGGARERLEEHDIHILL